MLAAAENLEFERAAQLRDRIAKLKGEPTAVAPAGEEAARAASRRGRGRRAGLATVTPRADRAS